MKNKFVSQNGFFELRYPDEFEYTYEENVLNVFPPNGASALTISSYHFANEITHQKFEELFEILTAGKSPINPRVELNQNVWFQQFEENSKDGKLIWSMGLNRNGQVILAITINYQENESDNIIDHYQQILNSIVNRGA